MRFLFISPPFLHTLVLWQIRNCFYSILAKKPCLKLLPLGLDQLQWWQKNILRKCVTPVSGKGMVSQSSWADPLLAELSCRVSAGPGSCPASGMAGSVRDSKGKNTNKRAKKASDQKAPGHILHIAVAFCSQTSPAANASEKETRRYQGSAGIGAKPLGSTHWRSRFTVRQFTCACIWLKAGEHFITYLLAMAS